MANEPPPFRTYDKDAVDTGKTIDQLLGVTQRAESILMLLVKANIPLSNQTYQALGFVYDMIGNALEEQGLED